MSVLWTIIVVAVLIGVALLFIVDALQQRTVAAKIAALLVVVGGAMFGAELWTPWVPIMVLVVATLLGIAGRLDDGPRRRTGDGSVDPLH
jgi:hypothetical protein